MYAKNSTFSKGILFLLAFVLSIPVGYSQDADVKILVPRNTGNKVGKWEKLELGLVLPKDISTAIDAFVGNVVGKDKINPFNPDELSVEAFFECTTGSEKKTHTIYGFYYDEFSRKTDSSNPNEWKWIRNRNDYTLRIRFAPDVIGDWTCKVKLVLNKEKVIEIGQIKFTCVESVSNGEIQLAGTNDARNRYLKYSDKNQMFFPVGLNLVWSRLDELKVGDANVYQKWFEQLAKAKANYVQLSSLPFTHGIEQEALNNYSARMTNAWELDELFKLAEKNGIYVNLLTLIHDEFITGQGWIHKNNHWTNNIYNSSKNGGKTNAVNPLDFFTDEKCKIEFRKRLRYILSRYGYSTSLPIIELLSEVDNAIPKYNEKSAEGKIIRKGFQEWFDEMKKYIKTDLGYSQKLVSASYTQGAHNQFIDNHVYSSSDVILMHLYGRDKFTNYTDRYLSNIVRFKSNIKTKNMPILFDEMGADFFPSLDKCSDITFHNSLWATALMGSFGTGQTWWWDNAIFTEGYEPNLKGIHTFLEDEDFTKTEFISEGLVDNGTKFKGKSKFETYYLKAMDGTKAIGWVHNISFYWANLKESNTCIAKLIEDNNGKSIDQSDNTAYKKVYEKAKAKGKPESKTGAFINLKLSPNTEYIVKWYNTTSGQLNGNTQNIKSSSSGKIKIAIPQINFPDNQYGDLAYKVVKFTR